MFTRNFIVLIFLSSCSITNIDTNNLDFDDSFSNTDKFQFNKCLKLDCEGDKIIIPHPRLHKRNFVLIPLYEISKKWTHPKYKLNISQLLKQIDTIDLRSITVE